MKEIVKRRSRTICSSDPEEYDKLYNSTSDELAKWDPQVDKFQMDGKMYASFEYVERDQIAETVGDDFMQQNARCTCFDCPELEITDDARRRWFPCKYAEYGETRTDTPACGMFYKMAVAEMRKKAGR